MPAILTHDFFGKDAFAPALAVWQMRTPAERSAFLLGNQGPDPLFYLNGFSALREFGRLGSLLHRSDPADQLVSMRGAAEAMDEEERRLALSYLAGYVCHYLLDRAAHPFVYFWERGICEAGVEGLDLKDKSCVHAEVERELDELVLYAKRNQTVETYRPYRETLRVSDETLETLGRLYSRSLMGELGGEEPTLSQVFPLAVRTYRVTLRLLWSKTGRKPRALSHFEGLIIHKRYSMAKAMSHRVRAEATSDFDNRERLPWRNPFTGEVANTSFQDIYEAALGEVGSALQCVFADDFDEDAARTLTRGINFSGEPVA